MITLHESFTDEMLITLSKAFKLPGWVVQATCFRVFFCLNDLRKTENGTNVGVVIEFIDDNF